MKKSLRTIFIGFAVAGLIACGNGNEGEATNKPPVTKETMQQNIEQVEKKAESHTELDLSTANSLLALYSDYAKNHPDDPKTPEYLFKAGRIATTLKQGKQAIDYFERAHNSPNFSKAPDALFLQGFVYETIMNDTANAKKTYQEVMTKYPDTQFAKDAQVSIDNMGKSPEELIREFEKKN